MKHLLIIPLCLLSLSLSAQMPNTLSKSEKVYGLSKFWQEVNYNFVYLSKVDREQWENEYKRLITEGQPMLFELPGGGSARVCTQKDTYPSGKEFVGYGVQPDIAVKKTLEDYLEGNDPVLKKAIAHLEKK